MIPCLALDRRSACELGELVRRCADQRQLAFFRQHEQQVLIGKQHELAAAVAPTLPCAFPVREIDAREDAAVEAEGMALVDNEVVEEGLQTGRGPSLFDTPRRWSVLDRE